MDWKPLLSWNWTLDKIRLSEWTGLPADALHIHAGMLILVVTALVLRRSPSHWLPWLAAVIAETLNELYDLTQTVDPSDEGNFRASAHDFWLTLLWPTVILILFRWLERRSSRPPLIEKADQVPE